jgi:predicted lipoprotein with Yx(FWY)xxD motif
VRGGADARITAAHRLTIIVAVVATTASVVLLILLLTRGSEGAKGDAASADRHSAPAPAVQVRRTTLGRILTDAHGRTLYLFDEDERDRSHCFAGCAEVWPPALVTGHPRAGAGVSAQRLTTTRRGKSARQLVYAGHPLYRLDADTRAGQMQGEGFGGTWWLVAPSGHRIIAPGMKRSKGGY